MCVDPGSLDYLLLTVYLYNEEQQGNEIVNMINACYNIFTDQSQTQSSLPFIEQPCCCLSHLVLYDIQTKVSDGNATVVACCMYHCNIFVNCYCYELVIQ